MGCVSSSEAESSTLNKNLPQVIFITGAPGTGKRTQCAKVVEKYGFENISVYQALKAESEGDSDLSKSIKTQMDAGLLISSATVVEVLDRAMNGKQASVYLIEGYPKNKENIEIWNKKMSGKYHVKHVFYFHCALDVLEKRLAQRGKNSGRADDSAEVIKQRIDQYKQSTRPIIDYYTKQNKIIHINSERQIERVFEQICSYVDQLIYGKEVRQPEILFFSGGIASGKRTQLSKLKEKFGWCTIDCSEVLRKAAENDHQIKADIAAGKLVSSQIVVSKLIAEMDKSTSDVYLITGFPKSQENLDVFHQKTSNMVHVKAFFSFNCSEQAMLHRLTTRGRQDDNIDAFKQRFSNFKKQTQPLNDHFQKLGKLINIDAEQPQEIVYRQILSQVNEKLFGQRIELPKVIFVVGGPGAGKGTQCAKIKETFKFEHYSTGDLLRAEVATGSELGEQIKKIQDEGGLVNSDLLVDIVKHNIVHKQGNFLLDGFPRNQENIDSWNKKMSQCCSTEFLLYFDCDIQQMEERMVERSKTSGRSDDNPETIKKRLQTFANQTKPIIDYFTKQNKVVRINADGDVDTIFNAVSEKINEKIIKVASTKPQVVFLLGGPGSGKGTQCDLIKANYKVQHHSPGELLRAEVAKGGVLAAKIKKIQDEGKLVSSELVVELLKKYILGVPGIHLLDGFPRNYENLDMWNKHMIQEVDTKFTLFFECSQEEMEKRVASRGETSNRSDDNPETMKKRIETFVKVTTPLCNWLQTQGNLVKISALNSKENVFEDVKKVFDQHFQQTPN